ncbi:MAG: PilZ domain-containing protein [Spirochaetes bacterium]|nr:PilZ domain-containing protein [Spirochaetota bacterium]
MVVFIVIILILFFVLLSYLAFKHHLLQIYFFHKQAGLKTGFTYQESKSLYWLAEDHRIANKTVLLNFENKIDYILSNEIRRILGSAESMQERDNKIALYFEIRRKVDLALDRKKAQSKKVTSRHLNPHQKVHVQMENGTGFDTSILGIDNNHIEIKLPEDQYIYKISWKEKKIKIYFWNKDDAEYILYSRIAQELKHASLCIVQISHSSHTKRIQKRRYRRADVKIPAEFRIIEQDKKMNKDPKPEKGWIYNLSARGMALRAEKEIHKDSLLEINFAVNSEPLSVMGKVINTNAIQNSKDKLLHIKFTKLKISAMNTIHMFVYDYTDKKGKNAFIS